ncbi:MAG: hypothetical protein KIH44_009895 [Octadecabacter sp.]|nr:hypothetical protein [Octadecabacter sp.]
MAETVEGVCQCTAVQRITKETQVMWFFRCSNTNGITKNVTIAGPVSQYPDEEIAKLAAISQCERWVAHCLDADTLVKMTDGSKQPISSLKPGDQILSTTDGQDVFVDTITSVDVSKHDATLTVPIAAGENLVASSTQPILSSKGMISVASLVTDKQADIKFGTNQSESMRVASDGIEPTFHEAPVDLYSLATERSEYFFVSESELIVKCKGPCGGDPPGPGGICR